MFPKRRILFSKTQCHAHGASRLRASRGQAAVEYLIILPSLLLIILGAIQMAFIYQAKATLNYATFLAARQGALHHGQLCVGAPGVCQNGGMQLGLAYGLLPLYAKNSGQVGKTDVPIALAQSLFAVASNNPLRQASIETVNPSAAWVRRNLVTDPYTGVRGVPNDNLMYRSTDLVRAGQERMNLQDGNLLNIKVTYCVKMDVPFANRVIYGLNNLRMSFDDDGLPTTGWMPLMVRVIPTGPCRLLNLLPDGAPLSGLYLPVVASAVVRMQTSYVGP